MADFLMHLIWNQKKIRFYSFSYPFFMLISINKKTFFRWLASTTNLKDVRTLYFIFGLFSGFVGRIFRLLIRTELRIPGPTFLSERAYNVIITAHGLIIIFFFVIPVLMGGFGNWLLPLLLGCGDIAFPRLNNFNVLIIFSFLFFISTAGWMYVLDLYLLIIDRGFRGGGLWKRRRVTI